MKYWLFDFSKLQVNITRLMNRLISNGSILVMYMTKNVPYQTVYIILGTGLPSIALLINTLLFRHKVIMNKKKQNT